MHWCQDNKHSCIVCIQISSLYLLHNKINQLFAANHTKAVRNITQHTVLQWTFPQIIPNAKTAQTENSKISVFDQLTKFEMK